jgi:beta-galactosidase
VLDVAPEDTTQITIDVSKLQAKPGVEYFITFSAKTTEDNDLLASDWEIASQQLKLPVEEEREQFDIAKAGKVNVTDSESIDISGKDFSVTINKESGIITSYKSKGQELFLNGFGPRPAFWRAPTDNDYGWRMPRASGSWKEATEQEFKAESIDVTENENSVVVDVAYKLEAVNSTWKTQYTVIGNGAIKVENVFLINGSNTTLIPRVGMKMQMPVEFTQVEYLGRGPWENYTDRNSSTFVGQYKTTVADLYVPYIRPQENGHRTDVRWMALTKDNGTGLLVIADSLIEFNALNNIVEDFDAGPNKDEKLMHENDIKPGDLVEVHIDYRMMGLAGDNSWGARPYEQYQIKPGSEGIKYGFTLIPVNKPKDIATITKVRF